MRTSSRPGGITVSVAQPQLAPCLPWPGGALSGLPLFPDHWDLRAGHAERRHPQPRGARPRSPSPPRRYCSALMTERQPQAPRLLLGRSEHFISNPSIRSSHESRPLWEGSGLQPLAGSLARDTRGSNPHSPTNSGRSTPTSTGKHREEEEKSTRGRNLTRPAL